ncbi:MAG: sulfite exporter TauE/SafE family protein [Magnetococcales bacterium]|nr:sulfite exporter TauE/SafE family protein [Magnetococcales bacterium]
MPSWTELWLVFTGGLLGSGHCVGMCGGLIAAYSLNQSAPLRHLPVWHPKRLTPHLLYHTGRIGTYMIIGATIGLVGSLFTITSQLAGMSGMVEIIAGAAMILMGLGALGVRFLFIEGNKPSSRLVMIASMLLKKGGPLSTLLLGVVTGLLPCSMHWMFQAKAAATGSWSGGMMVMAAFGLGALLPLTAFGFISTLLGQTHRQRMLKAAGILVIILGGMTLSHGLELSGFFMPEMSD